MDLQSQLDDKDRTIKIQQNLISKLEAEVNQPNFGKNLSAHAESTIETVCSATQTDRVMKEEKKKTVSISLKSQSQFANYFSFLFFSFQLNRCDHFR